MREPCSKTDVLEHGFYATERNAVMRANAISQAFRLRGNGGSKKLIRAQRRQSRLSAFRRECNAGLVLL